MTRVQIRRWAVAATFVILIAIHNVAIIQQRPAAELAFKLRVSTDSRVKSLIASDPSRARVYFDTGRGFHTGESVVLTAVLTPSTQPLFLPLPTGTLRSILFDSMEPSGTLQIADAIIQRPRTHELLHRFDPSRIVPGNQNASPGVPDGNLDAGAAEPRMAAQLTLSCDPPVTVNYTAKQIFSGRFFRVNALWLLCGVAFFLGRRLFNRCRPGAQRLFLRVDNVFAASSLRFANSPVLPLDRVALWFYALCLAVFAAMAIAGLHGSSITIYESEYAYSAARHQPLLGQPRGTRVDEWNYHTPTIINQILRRDRFATDSSLFGPDKAALFGNVPTDHWSEWFRPQFWVFHFLPPAAAYAFYWQTKGLLLLTGIFSLLLLLTRSSTAAALGALWYFLSPFTQWSYSWPTLFPEMVGLFGWVICFGAYLTVGRSRWRLAVVAALCTVCAVNFALCVYPPHQIPLAIFGLFLVTWWIWTHSNLIFAREARCARTVAVVGCWLLIALVMGLFYLDVRVGFTELAQTIYPGQRSMSGGHMTASELLSYFLDFWKSEHHYPREFSNICEGTGFLWLAPATLMVAWRPLATRRSKVANLLLWLSFLLLIAWIMVPVPATVGRVLLLDRVQGHRCLPALGLINIAIVAICLSTIRVRLPKPGFAAWRKDLVICFSVLALLLGAFAWMSSVNNHFFTTFEISTAAVYTAFLVFCLRNGWKRLLATALLLPAAATMALVNPVDRGLDVVLKSSLVATLERQPELKESRWLVFSSWITLPGFISASGVDLVNGLKIIPPKELERFDPTGKYRSVTNQSCYVVAKVLDAPGPSEFETPLTGVVVWKVNPFDPKLKEIGVRYVAFDSPPAPSIREKLKLIFTEESNNSTSIWAYQLP